MSNPQQQQQETSKNNTMAATLLLLLQRAVELNNLGLRLIIDNNEGGKLAIRCLSDAIATLKEAFSVVSTTSSSSSTIDDEEDCCCPQQRSSSQDFSSTIGKVMHEASLLISAPRMLLRGGGDEAIIDDSDSSSSFKVYNRFIYLPSFDVISCSANSFNKNTGGGITTMLSGGGGGDLFFGEMDQRLMASAILYNLGLAFQFYGLNTKAERIYNLVLQNTTMCDDYDTLTLMMMGNNNNRLSLIITLGSVTNLAYIWYSMGQHAKSQEVTSLVPCFMMMKEQQQEESNENEEEEDVNKNIFEDDTEVHCLLMNIMQLHAPTVAAAA